MYKSWIPTTAEARGAFRLSAAVRAKLALLFAWVARRFDWPCCRTADGRPLHRYYSTIANFREFAVEGLWPDVDRAPGENLKGIFQSFYTRMQGPLHRTSLRLCIPMYLFTHFGRAGVADELGFALPVPRRSRRAFFSVAEDMLRVRFTTPAEVGAVHIGYDPDISSSESSDSEDGEPPAPGPAKRGRTRADSTRPAARTRK
jgi:hypothetical protein